LSEVILIESNAGCEFMEELGGQWAPYSLSSKLLLIGSGVTPLACNYVWVEMGNHSLTLVATICIYCTVDCTLV